MEPTPVTWASEMTTRDDGVVELKVNPGSRYADAINGRAVRAGLSFTHSGGWVVWECPDGPTAIGVALGFMDEEE